MSLSTYNWSAFGAHLFLALFFSVYFPIINNKFPQHPQLRNQMAMQDHAITLKRENNRVELGWKSVTSLKTSYTTVQTLLVIFFYITAIFHLIYATSSLYPTLIKNHNNWLRWIEYAITSTLMIYIISLICTVKDTNTYILLGACNITMILLGQFVEEKIKAHESVVLPLSMSFFLLLCQAIVIIRESTNRIKQVDAYLKDYPSIGISKFPLWMFLMVPILLLFFSCFGGVAIYQSIYPDTDYETIEKAYIILSLLAKTTLGGFLAYGTAWGQQKFS